ncbi:MAG: PHB depolymerase family esterase [Nakamurella multipartita]
MMPTPSATRKAATRSVKKAQRTVTKAARAATKSTTAAPRKRKSTARPARSSASALPELWQPPGGQQPDPASLGKGTWHQHRYTGVAGTLAYRVYIPRGLRRTTRAPLVLALHGCTQSGLDFAAGTRWNDLADSHQFVVVYPDQSVTHHAQRCWNWFRPGHQQRAAGEPAVLAGIVRRVVQETTRWRIDPHRIYATGISAGGGMALVLAATYPELFAAVGVHSAPPFHSATGPADALAVMQGAGPTPTPSGPLPPLIVFQGTADGTVRSSNAERIVGQWSGAWTGAADKGLRPTLGKGRQTRKDPPRTASGNGPRPHRITRWSVARQVVLELWVVEGLGHAWSGGSVQGTYSDRRGPRASTAMWRFFAKHTASDPGLIGR